MKICSAFVHLIRKEICACIFLLTMFCLPQTGYAQQDTLLTVEVNALRWLTTEPGTKINLLDSSRINSTISKDISQLLSDATPVYFRNYGVSGLSSVGLRGTTANHTALMWNGIKIQLPSLQQADYSIIPAVFWDEIGLQHGPSISLNGADVAGGAVHLVNQLPKKGFHAKYISQLGSFGFQQQAITLDYGGSRVAGKSQFNYFTSRNDFAYQHFSGEAVRQQNAAVEQYNFLQHIIYQRPGITWKNIFWHGKNNRELPRTITGYNNRMLDNQQLDVFYRYLSTLSFNKKQFKGEFGYSYLQDELLYKQVENYQQDKPIFDEFLTNTSQNILRGQGNYELNEEISFSGGGQLENSSVSTSAYKVDNRLRLDYFLKTTSNFNTWRAHAGFKQIIFDNKKAPFIPSLGVEKEMFNSGSLDLSLSGKIARHFRFPTFNDLYWNPGGNPNLQPENGWSSEGTATIIYSEDVLIKTALTYFNLQVRDWILWRPSNGGFWAPENVWQVRSHGLETNLSGLFNINNLPVEVDVNYSFTKSLNKNFDNNQLAYVPVHLGNMLIRVYKKNWFISQSTSITGKRYTTQDNREEDSLPSYVLVKLSAGYNFSFGDLDTSLQVEVDNLLNQDYQTMQNRAMPGRNIQLQLLININK